MLQKLRKHITNHQGDANVSRMTMIAIVFVVGAILLVMTTSAFRNPINRWFSKVSNDWFASENGEFNLMIDPFSGYERNANGTIKGVKYICYFSDGSYEILTGVEGAKNGIVPDYTFWGSNYDASGSFFSDLSYYSGSCAISDDGTVITFNGQEYVAQPNA